MKSFRYGSRNSWLDKDQKSYFTLDEAWEKWWPLNRDINVFLFVYKDEELILVLDLKDQVDDLVRGAKYSPSGWRNVHLNASRDELAKHGIRE